MKYFALLLLAFLLSNPNPPKKCGTDELFQQMLEKEPAFKKAWIDNHRKASQGNGLTPSHTQHDRMQMLMDESVLNTILDQSNDENITIPVVVHVIAPNAAHPANISIAQIQSQIRELNRAFARDQYPSGQNFPPYWADDYADDSQIRFCLAATDPAGKPTKGVTQTFTAVPSFPYPSAEMKFDATGGKDAWPRSEYLNIWVVVITGGVPLGWATYPLSIYPAAEDGIVIDYRYFGTVEEAATPPFNLGRTCVHEVGHWLGLMHTWGMEGPDFPPCEFDDLIEDTPEQATPNYGCSPFTTTCDGEIDMLPNYMNYSTDVCNVFFTKGQVKRMRTTLAPGGFRFKLAYADKGCFVP